MKRLKSICLITSDVPGLRGFYANLLALAPEGDDVFTTFAATEINLSISSTQLVEQMSPGLTIHSHASNCFLEFEVEDVDKEYERLVALGVEILKPPTTQPWGLRSVWFCDPQGNRINFYAHSSRNETQTNIQSD